VLWADARGLDGEAIARRLLAGLAELEIAGGRAAIAATPIAAEVAARGDRGDRLVVIPPGEDRAFLAPLDVGVLHPPPPPHLYPLLAGVGVECCGDLAALDPEAVEVRFGGEGVRLWRLARADDSRPIFGSRLRELPSAELEWVDYELDRQEHVVFIVHSLLGSVCDALAARGEGAHALALEFTLASRDTITHPVRCSTPTACRRTWLRVVRATLERVTFEAPVTRIALRVEAATPLADRQGDLFDFGIATARVTEAALAHLLDKQADALAVAERSRHPLPERRIAWLGTRHSALGTRPFVGASHGPPVRGRVPSLTLQLLETPRPVEVRLEPRRDAEVPTRYRDGPTIHPLVECLGPDRLSGGYGEERYERECFQGIHADGTVVLLYRDLAENQWYVGGWWD
jgi:hypothetical protein